MAPSAIGIAVPFIYLIASALVALASLSISAAPLTFDQAKTELRRQVFHDQNTAGDLYCGCNWQWQGRSGGRMDLAACGYKIRAQEVRAERLEWEHVMPAWAFGHQRQCWQQGGRKNCIRTDPVFRAMEADMHNLWPTVGEVNADRSNYNFGQLTSTPYRYGACTSRVDFKQRVAEPRNEAKGTVARIQFYMHDRYGLNMSRQQQQLLMAWYGKYPVTEPERVRDQRIARVMGHSNPYVTGERTWSIGKRPSGEGLKELEKRTQIASAKSSHAAVQGEIIGNRNSKVFHLPQGCPSYNLVAERNRVIFETVAQAQAGGYRKAGNCR
ncbi:deoxyribonuclease I [Halopseudomonas pelagia]|uniref:Deoxyribonuclease I n=1 Tax=Halopseudomonas pelagia TaxID=553151 RepID=A0AA91TYP1_9GAMM|nr:deoxyribonuclease I [Halopseudomonas pelagia]QFY58757.1 deoxyribonuclease I [Halopseudomonas pelagia]